MKEGYVIRTFIGINIYGKRKYLKYGIDYKKNTEFWMRKFKEIKGRGIPDILYLITVK